MPMKAHKEENMNFTVKKAEAVYAGGGIYLFGGITTDGQHFIADDEFEWVMLTDEQTMTDELTDEEWNDMWYRDWQEAHMTYETQSEDEAREWLLAIYKWLLDNNACDPDAIRRYRDIIISEMSQSDTGWKGYKMTNDELMQYFVKINARLDSNWTADNAKEYDRIYCEILRRMEDFTGEPSRA